MSTQLSLLPDEAALAPSGLEYRPEFLSANEQAALLAHIDAAEWLTDLSRRVLHYGYKYDYSNSRLDDSARIRSLPEWLAHRDYGLVGTTIDVTVWDDHIEIHSPGSLPGHITTDNMRVERFSRNRLLMRTLRDLGLVEEFGERAAARSTLNELAAAGVARPVGNTRERPYYGVDDHAAS